MFRDNIYAPIEKGDIVIEKIEIQKDKMYTISDDAKVRSMPISKTNIQKIKIQNELDHYQNFLHRTDILKRTSVQEEKIARKKKWIGRIVAILGTAMMFAVNMTMLPLSPLASNVALISWLVSFVGGVIFSEYAKKEQEDALEQIDILERFNLELQQRLKSDAKKLDLLNLYPQENKQQDMNMEQRISYENRVNRQLQDQYQQLRDELITMCEQVEQEYHQDKIKIYTR